ncbi:DKNYY domain-containing protein [Alloalcanivorax xenomutans]|uniref:DKNYY domain-containing protein n=1 Tax=Alloalcanivorax xenomutans TaxID=1094342 RepID=UPI003BAAC648
MRRWGQGLAWVTAILALMVSLMLWLDPGEEPEVTRTDYPVSRYSHDEDGGIWFLQAGEGHQRVEGADPETFEPVPGDTGRGYFYSGLARDREHFYVDGHRKPEVNPDSVGYLGRHYYRADERVYYRNTLLDGAEAAKVRVRHGDYADDGARLYYQGHWIAGADVSSLSEVAVTERTSADFHYRKDANRVYYRGKVVQGAEPADFTVIRVEGDTWGNHYGYDGRRYFFKDQPLPDQVADTGRTLPPGALQLLQADKEFGWHVLFHEGDTFYFHQPFTNELKMLCRRDSSAPLETLAQGLYRDDRHLYYAWVEWDWNRQSRGGGRGLQGWSSGLAVVPDVDPDKFRFIEKARYRRSGSALRGGVYDAGGRRFFHPDYKGAAPYRAALMGFDGSGELRHLRHDGRCGAYTESPNRSSFFNDLKGMVKWIINRGS